MKKEAVNEFTDRYSLQMEYLLSQVRKEIHRIQTRKQVDPLKALLIELESIIGNQCYNGNIQNYGPFGEWEGEGRTFRYPVTFILKSKEDKTRSVSNSLTSDELMTGHYAFGANELHIFKALLKVIQHLENKYGFKPRRSDDTNT